MQRVRQIHPAWVAGIIMLAVLVWLLSGLGNDTPQEEQAAAGPETRRVTVRVTGSQAETIMREAVVSARTAPVRSVRLRAETQGRIAEIGTQRGARVAQGDVIVRLAPAERPAQLKQAQAVFEQRRLQYEAVRRLRADDYMTELELAQSRANLEIAQAEVERIRQDLERTVIRAPFGGILDRRPVEVGDYVTTGDEIGYLIELDPFIVRGSVSEDEVSLLRLGQPGSARLIDGQLRQGRIRYIASEADEQTRTYVVELEIDNPDGRLTAGTSAQLRLPLEEVSAHELEPAVLTLDAAGDFGIKSVDASNRVQFHRADIVRNESGRVWLSGLPPELRIITVGQGFVSAGDSVVVEDEPSRTTRQPRP